MLVQITAPHFCAGAVIDKYDFVVLAAPIIGYMMRDSWSEQKLRGYCKRKGWRVVNVHNANSPSSPTTDR